MKNKIFLLLIMSLCFQSFIFAQEEVSLQDRIIGSTFKTLAKAFVAVLDLEKLKYENIDKLNKMEEEKFKKRYLKVYQVIKDLPASLKAEYGITEEMNKKQVIRQIKPLTKKKIYEVIDSIPDSFIASQFRQYLAEKKQQIRQSNLVQQINKFWSRIIKKTKVSPPSP